MFSKETPLRVHRAFFSHRTRAGAEVKKTVGDDSENLLTYAIEFGEKNLEKKLIRPTNIRVYYCGRRLAKSLCACPTLR